MLQWPLGEGPLVVVAVDHDHAFTDASPEELEADMEEHIGFIQDVVRPRPSAGTQIEFLPHVVSHYTLLQVRCDSCKGPRPE